MRSAVVAGVVGVAGCGRQDGAPREASAAPADSAPRPGVGAAKTGITFTAAQARHGGVRWAPATATEVAGTLELPGQLVPNEDRTARLGAPAQGRVMTVHVQLGDRVTPGQPLVTLQSPEASAARADVDKAIAQRTASRAAAAFAREERERARRLFAIKAAARDEVERAGVADAAAQAALRQADIEVARAEAAAGQLGATSASGTMVLRSPMAGVVLSRDATPGAVATAGASLVTVSNPRTLWLEIAATDRAAAGVRPGTRVRFTVPAFPADTFAARVQSVGGALDTATRTVPVRAAVENAAGRLRAAMFATTWIEGGARRAAVLVPTDAVQLLDNRPVVFVARPDGRGGATFERRDVETGTTTGGQTPILRGIAPGDLVVVAGAFAVKSEFARAKMAE